MTLHRFAIVCLWAFAPLAHAATTEILPLSGTGAKDEAPVYWDFRLDTGRGSGEWKKIAVPSQWEQQGFGAYYYGTQGRGKPDDDPVIPKETGTYKRSFEIPATWNGRDVHLVFEAAMTDTTVFVNGKQAGVTHQGGFYRFSYDITSLVKPGSNALEVQVSKESANKSVNLAERRGDYWTFGGIYRPVWIEARPRHHITWTAIDARADGRFRAQVNFDEQLPRNTRVTAVILDTRGEPVGSPMAALGAGHTAVTLEGQFDEPETWTAETPYLYTVKIIAHQGDRKLHERTERFGFRTIEVRPNDGVYLNGSKIVLKGVNRHSFRPATGRTLTREQNYEDARLIKGANMNAVRMSHYPPDPAFLEAADELGLYVLNELAGWQGFYDTPTGARLIGQIVRRDVNHPSILFWDNGNEGGWNTDNDGEFARWDPQKRAVLHPWGIHSDINTDHYEKYDSTVRLSRGPQIFMPTEFLHGLYDGGIGAGFEDYWKVMGSSPTVAGGFFWAYADESVERTDQGNRLDSLGNAAPDGMLGPRLQKEGSYHTVRQIWSPVQISALRVDDKGALHLKLRNEFDFTNLDQVSFSWALVRLPDADGRGADSSGFIKSHAQIPGPALQPRKEMDWVIENAGAGLESGDVLHVTAWQGQRSLSHASLVTPPSPPIGNTATTAIERRGTSVVSGGYTLAFDADGSLRQLRRGDLAVALEGPRLIAYLRDGRKFEPLPIEGQLRKFTLAPRGEKNVLARAEYTGALRSLTWRIAGDQILLDYELAYDGDVDIFGIRFGYPSEDVRGKHWVGEGPYRIWKNRRVGGKFDLWTQHNTAGVPDAFQYPEFTGFFGAWRWLTMYPESSRVRVHFRNRSGVPFHGLYQPDARDQPVADVPDLGWSFLHAIPPIGTKFDPPDTLGPQSQVTQVAGVIRGEIAIALTPLH